MDGKSLPGYPNDMIARSLTSPAAPAAQTSAALKGEDKGFQAFGEDGFTFLDLIDIVNPLQHIPGVSTLYRELTGDQIDPGSKVAGSSLFGGPIGLIASLIDVGVEETTGQDIGEHVMALFKDDGSAPDGDTMIASSFGSQGGFDHDAVGFSPASSHSESTMVAANEEKGDFALMGFAERPTPIQVLPEAKTAAQSANAAAEPSVLHGDDALRAVFGDLRAQKTQNQRASADLVAKSVAEPAQASPVVASMNVAQQRTIPANGSKLHTMSLFQQPLQSKTKLSAMGSQTKTVTPAEQEQILASQVAFRAENFAGRAPEMFKAKTTSQPNYMARNMDMPAANVASVPSEPDLVVEVPAGPPIADQGAKDPNNWFLSSMVQNLGKYQSAQTLAQTSTVPRHSVVR